MVVFKTKQMLGKINVAVNLSLRRKFHVLLYLNEQLYTKCTVKKLAFKISACGKTTISLTTTLFVTYVFTDIEKSQMNLTTEKLGYACLSSMKTLVISKTAGSNLTNIDVLSLTSRRSETQKPF